METRELAVTGALEIAPPVFPDRRGLFCPVYQEADYGAVLDGTPFRVVRSGLSVNRTGVVRGVHYARSHPGTAKIILCAAGEALDLVVDVRVGSPTFGHWDSVRLTPARPRAVYCPPGVGHAFVSLAEGTVLVYLLSTPYRPEDELAVSVLDPALGLPVPRRPEPVMSDRDSTAPTLAEALDHGLLPAYRPGGGDFRQSPQED
ncbi:dTDP-4-dehydrorhamnose 3,5-epimerase [Streptomyces calidiresistens]|uniref:dTDP-4-keto-6-deoxy-D-glucose epimerase n=1 Tax=Streptomyces calidiresistens TaxID=1485586 RepID=A0A7W3XUS0_9ACTN|nr:MULTISPECIES: dTDP-4-dehydrorhamnose 3,5-epimerase [Streptomyces]MBB0228068.1 dTDP-4-keto-6-deoxy-D-glucose epimerase [Streptomyces calidiresistens]MQS05731.1 dTDP-4-keto-6-deoxy-D-glucose epimerase [Streptomyces alkaliphilus]